MELYIATTARDVIRRSTVRIACCAVPYFTLAWLWSVYRDDRLFHAAWYLWCVVLIPGAGLALDLWRLTTRRGAGSERVS